MKLYGLVIGFYDGYQSLFLGMGFHGSTNVDMFVQAAQIACRNTRLANTRCVSVLIPHGSQCFYVML